MPNLLEKYNIKVVVNCGLTEQFLNFIDESQPVISSDVIVLNLDPNTSHDHGAFQEFHARYNRVLQNYLAFFYKYNQNVLFFVNSTYQDSKLAFDSPTLNGVPLKLLFNVNRLLKLIKNINLGVNFLFVAEHFEKQHLSNGLLYSLAILYLMDNYNYNFDASLKYLQSCLVMHHGCSLFCHNHYDDMLLIDSLKKFYKENSRIKAAEDCLMTKNIKLKRRLNCMESVQASCKRLA